MEVVNDYNPRTFWITYNLVYFLHVCRYSSREDTSLYPRVFKNSFYTRRLSYSGRAFDYYTTSPRSKSDFCPNIFVRCHESILRDTRNTINIL